MNFASLLAVALGGALGSLARYGVSALALPISRELPMGTLIINIVGSFVIGFFGTLTLAHGKFPAPEPWRLFVLVGVGLGHMLAARLNGGAVSVTQYVMEEEA